MPVLAPLALATAVVGTGYSIYEGQQSAKASRQAAQFQQQQADLVAARQQRDAVRQARIANAKAQTSAENQGVGLSSSAQGGQGSIVSQMHDTLSFLDKYNYFSDQASQSLGRAQQFKANAESGGQIAGLGMTVFQNAAKINAAFGGGSGG